MLKECINAQGIGSVISRKNLRKQIPFMSRQYIDSIRRQLTVCGYLKGTDRQGEYILQKLIERELTTTELRKRYESLL